MVPKLEDYGADPTHKSVVDEERGKERWRVSSWARDQVPVH